MKMIALVITALVALEVAAVADTPQSLYAEGQAAYDRADYATAIAKWRASYDLSHAPGLLFNLAQAYRLSGDCMNALLTYEQFTTIDPASAQRQLADDLARELEAQCGASRPIPPISEHQHHDDRRSEQPRSGRDLKIAGLATGGAGVALITTGLVLGRHAQAIAAEVTRACTTSCDWTIEESRDASGRRYAASGQAIDAIGAAAIVGGAILYYLGDREDGISVAPTDRSRGAILSWSQSW